MLGYTSPSLNPDVPRPRPPEPEFKAFPPIARLMRPVVVTEKIDGTNAVVWISEDGSQVRAGSRTRWITPADDNFGFARWVADHAAELRGLGPGYHYGEWWGKGIQRGYGLKEKRWSVFNVGRWGEGGKDEASRPSCCHVVPVLGRMDSFNTTAILNHAAELEATGSRAAPGFIKPEGICIWHDAAQAMFKFTLGGDGHKGARR